MEVTMANEGDRGSTNPTPGSHPRMSAGLPPGPGGATARPEEGLMGKVSEAAGQARERIRDVASGVAERVGDAWESTRQGAEQLAHRAQDFWTDAANLVRRRPMAALAVAFGVGCLVGCCLTAASRNWEDDVARRMSRASA
jgi:ElaB/YqjD/DUF883 family membrane-anchored ribosome-binding protein